MNFRLASNIYRKPWLIEAQTALTYLDLLESGRFKDLRGGFFDEDEEEPKTIFQKLFAGYDSIVAAPVHSADAIDHPGYEGKTIAILPITGPLMKEDFCGWYGMASLKNELNRISSTKSIKAIVALMDSPGGTVDGTEALAMAYKNSAKKKITLIDGMMASAAYWIGSAGDQIIATSGTDEIGSIGTMLAFWDNTKAMEDRGYVRREFYADASKDKNLDFREARDGVNKGRKIIENILNPTNDVFVNAVKQNRGDKLNEKETLTGKVFVGKNAKEVGLIDEIANMDDVLNELVSTYGQSQTLKFSI